MNIVPKASSGQSQSTQPSQAAQSAKARAIAMLTSVPTPQNQNAISPEDTVQTAPQTSQDDPQGPSIPQPGETLQSAPETTTEAPKTAVEDPMSKQFAILARKEKQMRQKLMQDQQALKSERDAWQAEKAQMQAKLEQLEQSWMPKDRVKSQTLQVLAEAGVSWDELTQQVVNQQPVNPQVEAQMRSMETTIRKLEERLANGDKSQQQAQQQQYQAALNQITSDVKSLVSSDPNFETVKATNSIRDVVELIEKTYQEEGMLLSVEEASQQVEDYLIEEALKLSKLSKIQQRLKPATSTQTPAQPVQQTQPTKPQSQMKTLTNATSSNRQLSAKERAVLAFQGKLTS